MHFLPSMEVSYTMSTELIGRPDPLCLDYIGTYSPPALYALSDIEDSLRLVCARHPELCVLPLRGASSAS